MFVNNRQIDVKLLTKKYDENRSIFTEVSYMFERYGVNYCIAIIEIDKKILDCIENISSFIRNNDKYIKIKKDLYIIIFTYTNYKQAHSAIYELEKNILRKCGVFLDEVFHYAITEKQQGDDDLKLLIETKKKLVSKDIKIDIIV